jgi:hypothetical protein
VAEGVGLEVFEVQALIAKENIKSTKRMTANLLCIISPRMVDVSATDYKLDSPPMVKKMLNLGCLIQMEAGLWNDCLIFKQ